MVTRFFCVRKGQEVNERVLTLTINSDRFEMCLARNGFSIGCLKGEAGKLL